MPAFAPKQPAIVAFTLAALGAMMTEVWTVREPIWADQWAQQRRRIPARGNAEPGPWDNERTPYNAEPMRACSDPSLTQVSMMKASQLGATDSLIFNTLGWAIDESPGPELIIMPSDRLAKRTVKMRLIPSIKASPTLRAKYASGKAESTTEVLVFSTMDVVLAGSNSATNVRSTPFRRVKIDDFDLCEPSTKEEATQRMASFENDSTMLVCVGTPSYADTGIHAEYEAGDRRRYLCPCPHCGTFHEWIFDNLVWSGGINADPGKVLTAAYMRCPSCLCRIENNVKPWCLHWGCWQPDGVNVEPPAGIANEPGAFREWTKTKEARDLHEVGFPHPAYRITGEADHPAERHRSYRISSLYSPFKPFGWVAEAFIRSGGRPERDWRNGKLGLPARGRGEDVSLEAVRALCIPEDQGGYKSGTVPADIVVLVTAIDVGADHCHVLTVGYTNKMQAAAWIDARRIEAPRGMLKAIAPELQALSFEHGAGGKMRPVLFFPDSRHRTGEVYDLCLALGAHHAYPILGVATKSGDPVTAHTFSKGPDGEALPGTLQRYRVDTNHWSEEVWARIYNAAGLDRDEKVAIDTTGAKTLRMPENVEEAHLRMFTSEHCVKGVWEKKPGREDNHLVDCLRYAEAGLFKSGGMLITPEYTREIHGWEFWGWTPPEGTPPPAIVRAQRAFKQTDDPLVRRVQNRTRPS